MLQVFCAADSTEGLSMMCTSRSFSDCKSWREHIFLPAHTWHEKQRCSFLPPQREDAEWVTPVFQWCVIRERGKQKADNLFCPSVRGLYSLAVQLLAQRPFLHLPAVHVKRNEDNFHFLRLKYAPALSCF